MEKILVILGPTSTSKTDLALQLANKFQGELVSVDSRQVYKKLDIGTGKMPDKKVAIQRSKGFWIMDGVKIWMYDVTDPKKQYTVFNYIKDASRIISDICKRKKLPIMVGGTGFYLKALLEGLPNLAVPVDQKLRRELNNLGVKQLQQKLQEISPDKWNSLNESDMQNPRRLVRAIEIIQSSNVKVQMSKLKLRFQNYNVLKIGLTAPRGILYRRIDERITSRINQGMVDEAKNLHKNGLSFKRMKKLGLEYGILADFLQGRIAALDELIKIMQGKIHGFARRQITWFKKEKGVKWFDITSQNYLDKVEELVSEWYYINYDKEN